MAALEDPGVIAKILAHLGLPTRAQPLDSKVLVTLEDLAISSMWETAVLVAVVEEKDVL